MITMENTRELIDFEYYGKSYRMAPDEIEAAYRYHDLWKCCTHEIKDGKIHFYMACFDY